MSWFEDITALNIRPNRGGQHIGPPFFTSTKEDSDTQVRGHCSVAEVIHNLLCFSKICHGFAKIHRVRQERLTTRAARRSSRNVIIVILSYCRHF